jgi:hypothetical protein
MRPVTVTVGPLATASANNICLSQTPTAAFTLNGALVTSGVATLDTPRRVLFTTTSNESAKTITIVGTDWNYAPQTEVITGPNATTGYTNLDFRTVTSITISAAAAGAITVGTNTIASSMWVRLDEWAYAQTAMQCVVTGTVNYTVQQSMQDPNSPTNPVLPYSVVWLSSSDTAAVTAITSIQTSFVSSPIFVKVTLNSGTGSVSSVISQFGAVPY